MQKGDKLPLRSSPPPQTASGAGRRQPLCWRIQRLTRVPSGLLLAGAPLPPVLGSRGGGAALLKAFRTQETRERRLRHEGVFRWCFSTRASFPPGSRCSSALSPGGGHSLSAAGQQRRRRRAAAAGSQVVKKGTSALQEVRVSSSLHPAGQGAQVLQLGLQLPSCHLLLLQAALILLLLGTLSAHIGRWQRRRRPVPLCGGDLPARSGVPTLSVLGGLVAGALMVCPIAEEVARGGT
ncbi:uncharacterized protein LOC132592191 [Zootoca vivipara]|uniref:uncharacterized protein LOC132592191 n=1 Tax=Zootoca vivipara TaxID=8524 RepID=UPI00293BBA8F|nr:uncharacterized protein LOC132592191 [Zootoca vivipara]